MPLLDHFHPPLDGRRKWESFHALWASEITTYLNAKLPRDYFAEAQVHAFPRIEVDVATLHEPNENEGQHNHNGNGAVATLVDEIVAIDEADITLPTVFPPEYTVNVFETSGGPTLVAAIELVSPGNKDRIETRRAFVAKCQTYIQRAIGLIVLDVVTNRQSRPFEELFHELSPELPMPTAGPLTAVSYRPVKVRGADSLELRIRTLTIGQPLPKLPLALGGLGHVTVDFETTYETARKHSRL